MAKEIANLFIQASEMFQENYLCHSFNLGIYKQLIKILPSLFPQPDEFYTKIIVASEYDCSLVYNLRGDEKAESLRLILSVIFGLEDWEIEIQKFDKNVASLRAIKNFLGYRLLIRITGVDRSDFNYTIGHDTGTVLSGMVQAKRFEDFSTPRPDTTPTSFVEGLTKSSYHAFLSQKMMQVCQLAAKSIPANLIPPTEIQPALGLKYDLDITYDSDYNGYIRSHIDKTLGYVGWAATYHKELAIFNLHTILPLKCDKECTLMVRVNILDAARDYERVFLVKDDDDKLIYRATRPTDPDYDDIVELFETELDDITDDF